MERELERIAEDVVRRLEKQQVAGKTITLKIKYSDFTIQTRSKTLKDFISSKEEILLHIKDLLYQERLSESVRLLGISVSHLNNEGKKETVKQPMYIQLKLEFPEYRE